MNPKKGGLWVGNGREHGNSVYDLGEALGWPAGLAILCSPRVL